MTKNQKMYSVIGLLLAIVAVAFALFWPATASFNTTTGTLCLRARFRRKRYPLKDFIGKMDSTTIGPIVFDVDYLNKGIINYEITLKASSKSLLKGTVRYKFVDTLATQLPPDTAGQTDSASAASRATCACNHN